MGAADGDRGWPQGLAAYAAELERWNRQINLVSRQDTSGRIVDLIDQCAAAWRGLRARPLSTWGPAEPVRYFDLGSGGGLPGFVWHLLLREDGRDPRTLLVEPRDKRAWFLERLGRIPGGEGLGVARGRWDEIGAPAEPAQEQRILISLKALRLQDGEILGGLAPWLSPAATARDIVIARFHPADQQWDDALVASLGSGAAELEVADTLYRVCERSIVQAQPAGPAALAVVRYEARSRS